MVLDYSHRLGSTFEPGRVFANHLDFKHPLPAWAEKVRGVQARSETGVTSSCTGVVSEFGGSAPRSTCAEQ